MKTWIISIICFMVAVKLQAKPNLISDCQAVQHYWQQNFQPSSYFSQQVNTEVCKPTYSRSPNCCNNQMLTQMLGSSEHDPSSRLHSLYLEQAESFRNDSILLKTFVTETLGLTMGDLDQKFKQDLGYVYEQHKQIFFDFFSTIQAYLFGKKDNLNGMVDSFFDELLSRMTQILLNVKPTADMTFAKCFAAQLKTKRPFENIPDTIIKMTREAFPPMRLAINSMAFAHEALTTAANPIQLSAECTSNFMRLKFCSLCSGLISLSPCDSGCKELANSCAPQQLGLSDAWREYIVLLRRVLNRLQKFPQVHRPLQMHLTDGIMNLRAVFNRHEQEITTNCSGPDPSFQQGSNTRQWASAYPPRHSRQAPGPWGREFEPKPLPSVALASQGMANLNSLTESLQQKYEHVENLFENVGLELCKSSPLSPASPTAQPSSVCWNGTSVESTNSGHSGSPLRRAISSPTDPLLERVYKSLQQSKTNIHSILESFEDPPVLTLQNPSATALKFAKNGRPVSSDHDALTSYLITDPQISTGGPPMYSNNNMQASQGPLLFNQPTPMASIYPGNQPASSMPPHFIDTRYPSPQPQHQWPPPPYAGSPDSSLQNSAYHDPMAGGVGPYAPLPADDEDNRPLSGGSDNLPLQQQIPFGEHPSLPSERQIPQIRGEGHASETPIRNFIPDDEDFMQRPQGSGFPPDMYQYSEHQQGSVPVPPIAGNWPTSSEQEPPSPYGPLPPFEGSQTWDREPPEGDENSGVRYGDPDGIAQPPYGDPINAGGGGDVWGAMKPDKVKGENTGLSSLGTGGTPGGNQQQEIPSQIWIPDREGVVHMSIPPLLRTTSLASLKLPSLILLALSATLLILQ